MHTRRTASDGRCGSFATRQQVGPHDTAFSIVGLASTKYERSDDAASQFDTPAANVASRVNACTGIVEPFKHLLRALAYRIYGMPKIQYANATAPCSNQR